MIIIIGKEKNVWIRTLEPLHKPSSFQSTPINNYSSKKFFPTFDHKVFSKPLKTKLCIEKSLNPTKLQTSRNFLYFSKNCSKSLGKFSRILAGKIGGKKCPMSWEGAWWLQITSVLAIAPFLPTFDNKLPNRVLCNSFVCPGSSFAALFTRAFRSICYRGLYTWHIVCILIRV